MAEEGIVSPATPEISNSNGGNSRRTSMGQSASLNSGKQIVPHYLRASTGSCHDFCKFGRKHAIEAQARHPIRRQVAAKSFDNQNPVEILVLPERKERNKTSVVKLRPSNSKASKPDTSDIIKREVSTKAPVKLEVTTKSTSSENPMKTEIVAEKKKKKKKMVVVKHSPSPNLIPCLPDTPESVKRVVSSSSEKIGISLRQASPKAKEGSLYGKDATSSKLKPSTKGAASLKPKSVKEKTVCSPGSLSDRNFSDTKTQKSTKAPKGAAKKVSASPRAALLPRPSLVRVASLNARKLKGSKVVSSLKNEKKIKKADQPNDEVKQANNDMVQEKTLYVIKMETENKPLESNDKENYAVESYLPPLPLSLNSSDEKESHAVESALPPSASSPSSSSPLDSPSSSKGEDQDESKYMITESEGDSLSEYDETVNMEEEDTLKNDDGGRSREVHADNNDCQPAKLIFRRGKVVDIQTEHNSPRRLKFRQGRMLGDNRNIKGDGRRSFKKRGVVDSDTTANKTGSVKVVLRHQDVQGKKDEQGLFNNVIEETASKLVETRKSKVKALVGAFETVISLQERKKPSTNHVS